MTIKEFEEFCIELAVKLFNEDASQKNDKKITKDDVYMFYTEDGFFRKKLKVFLKGDISKFFIFNARCEGSKVF